MLISCPFQVKFWTTPACPQPPTLAFSAYGAWRGPTMHLRLQEGESWRRANQHGAVDVGEGVTHVIFGPFAGCLLIADSGGIADIPPTAAENRRCVTAHPSGRRRCRRGRRSHLRTRGRGRSRGARRRVARRNFVALCSRGCRRDGNQPKLQGSCSARARTSARSTRRTSPNSRFYVATTPGE
jgi:hypothetical protein